jgi:photosystem II stability/assembly factor-like uncharacterized protein
MFAHWMGDVEIDPHNSDHVLFVTGYGIWATTNATQADAGQPTRWTFDDAGLEESVPLGLISPPEGARLLSALGDISGFRHDDLTVTPPEGGFKMPQKFANGESLAFAAQRPNVIAFAGTIRERLDETRGSFSLDGGRTWLAFASEPPDGAGAGSIAVSADGQTLVWTPRRGRPHYSRNCGTNWTKCIVPAQPDVVVDPFSKAVSSGHNTNWLVFDRLPRGLRVVADPVNASRFYAFDSDAGRLYLSTNGAATFTAKQPGFEPVEGFGPGFGGEGGPGGALYVAPGTTGELWIGFRSRGLYHSAATGSTFTKVSGVQETYSLGFGKAVPGKKYPALYLAGKVAGCHGLFRSDDAGKTWMRINDDEHQYGWINHVTGDPRIYGRVYFGTGGRGIIYGDPAASAR